jgi:hypothetical protein
MRCHDAFAAHAVQNGQHCFFGEARSCHVVWKGKFAFDYGAAYRRCHSSGLVPRGIGPVARRQCQEPAGPKRGRQRRQQAKRNRRGAAACEDRQRGIVKLLSVVAHLVRGGEQRHEIDHHGCKHHRLPSLGHHLQGRNASPIAVKVMAKAPFGHSVTIQKIPKRWDKSAHKINEPVDRSDTGDGYHPSESIPQYR